MKRWMLVAALAASFGCADEMSTEVAQPAPTTPVTVSHPVLDSGPNWFVAGGEGLVELVGGIDGEPDQLTGRFAFEGQEIFATASGANNWVVAGTGRTQPLDDDGTRLRAARTALSGEPINFVEASSTGYVIGGGAGRFQALDATGEPTATEIELLGGSPLTAASLNALGSTWLVGAENGETIVVNSALDDPTVASSTVDGGKPVTAIVEGPGTPAWFAFTADSVVEVSALGNPGASTAISGGNVTAAATGNGKVFVGTSDGRLGVANAAANPSFSFTPVLSGGAVTDIVTNGTDWIVLGANGQAQRFDSNGATMGGPVQVTSDASRALVGAHWSATDSEWRLVVGELGFIAFVDAALALPRDLTGILGGAALNDASVGDAEILVVGDGGAYQIVDDRGATVTQPESIGSADLYAAEWNGEAWLVAGAGGFTARIGADGTPIGSGQTILDGSDIHFAAWSGEYWLVGGVGGKFQFVRFDGTTSGSVRTIAEASELHDARWNGREWMVVGETPAGTGVAALITSDPNAVPTVTTVDATGPLYAVDFNGIEWLTAGAGGLIQRINAQGATVDVPANVLTGFDILDVDFNGSGYILAGNFGAVQRLGQDYLPIRSPISVIDRAPARVIAWTEARGFPSGPCLSDEACYRGPCVGGLTAGRCCDSACDRPCESCFQNDTGEADGTCAPVVAGKQPPPKNGTPTNACPRQSESTCGFTGVCDGAGECEYYGDDIECAAAVCTLGKYTPISFCDSTGACAMESQENCAPYVGCNDTGCLTSCTSKDDCVDGFVCESSACVEDATDGDNNGNNNGTSDGDGVGDGGGGDGGCCATTRPSRGPIGPALAAIFLAVVATRRRMR